MSEREDETVAEQDAREQPPDSVRLCEFIDQRREDILREWEKRARDALAAAQRLSEPALRDHLPKLLVWISDLVRTAHTEGVTTPGALPEAHAEMRIEEGYSLIEAARELALLRQVIQELWGLHASPTMQVAEALRLHGAIDLLIARSVQAFAAAEQRDIRQHLDMERQMIGIVAHDLRNPISAISTTAEGLLRRPADDRLVRAVVRIRNAAFRSARLIQDLLDFTQARLGCGIRVKREPADLHAIVKDVVDDARIQAKDREIHLEREGDGTALLDADRVAQAADNLLGNAIKHGAAGSPITVETRGEDTSVVLTVQNWGPPIPADALAHLFEPLRQGLNGKHTNGVGLGLFIVKSIVDAHGGAVGVRSTEAEGTAFTVRLPRAPAPGEKEDDQAGP